jgi:hypothetical protein
MKNFLLSAAALATLTFSASAQRMTLHEEFTGENCGPCASTNPGFWTLCNGAGNPSKLIHIAYMVPIPSAGFYCNRTSSIHTVRTGYYSVPFAPYGRYDGKVPNASASSPGHPGFFTQADIDAEAAIPDSFTITATSAWNATYTQVITTVNVTNASAFTWSATGSAGVRLRAALVQTNDFATSPGSNGETHFENVVQAMYPDATGTTMPTTWTPGMTQSFVVTGTVPSWVDKTLSPYMVVWMQNDNNKIVQQAAKGNVLPTIAVDAGTTASAGPSGLICATGSYSAAHTVTLKNTGSTTLTSADILYSVDGGAFSTYAWTGSLAAGATAVVTMPAIPVTVAQNKYHTIKDSVAMPNGSADVNLANNVSGTYFFVENSAPASMPFFTSFEGTDTSYYATDVASDGETWGIYKGTSTTIGHSGIYTAGFQLGFIPTATSNTLVLPVIAVPTPASSAISFWVAYSQIATTNTDMLEVVYSTDCGGTWTSLWNVAPPTVTLPLSTTTLQLPSSPSQYKKYSVSLASVPAGNVMLGFRATDAGGNSLWVDDINVKLTTAVEQITEANINSNIYPNPAVDEAMLSFSLGSQSNVTITIVDGLGRTVSTVADKSMNAGMQSVSINTAGLATGVYNVMIHTDGGTFTQRMSVVK